MKDGIERRGRFEIIQPHNPAFWLYIILLGIGTVSFVEAVNTSIRSFPSAFLLAVSLWALYIIPWVIFIRHEELFNPEPTKLALMGFLWGGFIATFAMSLEANNAVISLLGKIAGPEFAGRWGASISAPIVEELSKGLGVVVLLLLARPYIRSTFDGAILGAFTGLGFQVLEDLIYSLNAAALTAAGGESKAIIGMFLARGFHAGLWSHALYSAIVGAGIAYFATHENSRLWKRLGGLILFCGSAWALHFFWDSPYVNGRTPTGFMFVAKLVLYPSVFLTGLLWVLRQKRKELMIILNEEVKTGLVPQGRRRNCWLSHILYGVGTCVK